MTGYPVAIDRLATLVLACDAAPLNKHAGPWEYAIDEHWCIAWNGHPDTRKTSKGDPVPPYTCVVWYNGWPAGMLDPSGGIIAAGTCANEDAFLAAIEEALKTAVQTPLENHIGNLGAVQPEGKSS